MTEDEKAQWPIMRKRLEEMRRMAGDCSVRGLICSKGYSPERWGAAIAFVERIIDKE
jgi:hypothetical protein